MKKHLFFLLILMTAGLGSCTQSTDDSKNPEHGLGPDHDAVPEGVGNAGERKQEESNTQLSNSPAIEDSLSAPGDTTTNNQ